MPYIFNIRRRAAPRVRGAARKRSVCFLICLVKIRFKVKKDMAADIAIGSMPLSSFIIYVYLPMLSAFIHLIVSAVVSFCSLCVCPNFFLPCC
jgi:hypothetical protein